MSAVESLYPTWSPHIRRYVRQAVSRCPGRVQFCDVDDLVSEVLLQLVRGDLERFRGENDAQFRAYLRVICQRTTWALARRRRREQAIAEAIEGASQTRSIPPQSVEFDCSSPLALEDRTYLRQLLRAGSQAELAREQGVSRSAVTQRLQRIQARLGRAPAPRREAHEGWLRREAALTVRNR